MRYGRNRNGDRLQRNNCLLTHRPRAQNNDMKRKNIELTDHEIMGDEAFEKAIAEYWAKELAKSQPKVYYLPTAQRGAESLIGPLEQL
jgi:hypothetical protein